MFVHMFPWAWTISSPSTQSVECLGQRVVSTGLRKFIIEEVLN